MEQQLPDDLQQTVSRAISEDVGTGDLTASLVPADASATATVVVRQAAVIAGAPWFDEVFRQLDASIRVDWQVADGASLRPDQTLCTLSGPARPILTGERTALNFLQMLSGIATETQRYTKRIKGTGTQIVDTRKTLPGLRSAQKYAIVCGGGVNHRMGLFDAILIKENHIMAAGSITAAARQARTDYPDMPIQIEVENLDELDEALACDAESVLFDNFPTHILARAVNKAKNHWKPDRQPVITEASGNINYNTVREIADTGADRVSVGALTKNVDAIDLSMRMTVGQ